MVAFQVVEQGSQSSFIEPVHISKSAVQTEGDGEENSRQNRASEGRRDSGVPTADLYEPMRFDAKCPGSHDPWILPHPVLKKDCRSET